MLVNRLYAYGIALLVVLLSLWGWGHSRYKAGEAAAEARMAEQVAELTQTSHDKETVADARVALLQETHDAKVAQLDTRLRDALARVGRVQVCPRSSTVREAPSAPSNPVPDRPGRDSEDGEDIAPALMLYAKEKEQMRLELNLCRDYFAEIERFRAQ